MNNNVQQIRELEEALCEANGKLFAIQNVCEQEIINSEEAMETVTDGSEGIYEGRVEFAKQISNLIEPDPDDFERHNQCLNDIERCK